MTDSGGQPPHFHWIQSDPPTSAHPGAVGDGSRSQPTRRRARKWLFVLVPVLVCVLVGAGLWWGTNRHRGADNAPPTADADQTEPLIGTPPELLVPFSLQRQPVSAWTITPRDVGLPEWAGIGEPFGSEGDTIYILSNRGNCPEGRCPKTPGWVYAVNGKTGERLLDPVYLPDGAPLYDFDGQPTGCRMNGPKTAICHGMTNEAQNPDGSWDNDHPGPRRIWTLDLDAGKVTYTGLSDNFEYDRAGGSIDEVGALNGPTRLVLTDNRRDNPNAGIYGIDAQGAKSWYVPGGGTLVAPIIYDTIDTPPQTLATQLGDRNASDANGRMYRVFSVADGADLTPTPPSGWEFKHATTYVGGFAYEARDGARNTAVFLYDQRGRPVAQVPGLYLVPNPVMPIVIRDGRAQVYTNAGRLVKDMPAPPGVQPAVRLIGTKVFALQTDPDREADKWNYVDLLTDESGPSCSLKLGNFDYEGSDGHVVLTRQTSEDTTLTSAVDVATCQILWNFPEYSGIWKLGNNLIESPDTHADQELAGLTNPT